MENDALPPIYKLHVSFLSVLRLPHSPSLLAIVLSVGYETWPPIGWHHTFLIGWSKYTLGTWDYLMFHCIVGSHDWWTFPPFFRCYSQSKGTIKESYICICMLVGLICAHNHLSIDIEHSNAKRGTYVTLWAQKIHHISSRKCQHKQCGNFQEHVIFPWQIYLICPLFIMQIVSHDNLVMFWTTVWVQSILLFLPC